MEIQQASPFAPPRLPGFVQLFLVQLYFGAVYAGIVLLGVMFLLVTEMGFFGIPGEVKAALLACGLLAAWALYLCVRCIIAIHGRSPATADRCRFVLQVSLVCGALLALGILVLIILKMDSDILWGLGLDRGHWNFPRLLGNALVNIVLCVAWLRYFAESPNVWRTFRKVDGDGLLPASSPSEIAIFRILCYVVVAYYGIPSLVSLYSWVSSMMDRDIVDGGALFPVIVPWVIRAGANIIIPLCAVAALNRRQLSGIFWGLGIWMGIQFAFYIFAMAGEAMREGDFGRLDAYTTVVTVQMAMAVVFWWYFYTSEKARAWFSGGQPVVEQRN